MFMRLRELCQRLKEKLKRDRVSGRFIFALLLSSVVLAGVSVGNFASSVPQPTCETGSVGAVCSDGAIYSGTVNGIRFYAAPSDEGDMMWSNVYENTGATSLTDGLANTNILVALGSNYQAATTCRAKGEAWYLPSKDELNVMYANRAAIGGLNNTGRSWYWSSSEHVHRYGFNVLAQRFSDGAHGKGDKQHHVNYVRCVRR